MTERNKIHSLAPTRIDLAGGTLDLWPIYLLFQKPGFPAVSTINLGISLFAETHLTIEGPSSTGGFIPNALTSSPVTDLKSLENLEIELKSLDQGTELRYAFRNRYSQQPPPALELHFKLFHLLVDRHIQWGLKVPNTHRLTLETRAQSPAGAGLGGSSTLGVSMIGAIQKWLGHPIQPEGDGGYYIETVRDVETTVIRVPAGMQDYYGAMYGGLQKISWEIPRPHPEQLFTEAHDFTEFQNRLVLFYSGKSRNSGINNWDLFKKLVDRDAEVHQRFETIWAATRELEMAILKRDWAEMGRAIESEWTARKGLAPGISSPEIDRAFEIAARLGVTSGKICGAGGGGCFFFYLPRPSSTLKAELIQQISETGIRHLPFHPVSHGLQVTMNCHGSV